MSKIILLLCTLLAICHCSFAQNKYEIGVEGGLTFDKYNIQDAGDNLRTVPCLSGMGGVNFRINTKKKFLYEIALMAKAYTEGIKMKQQAGYGTTNADEVILLPIRVGYTFKLNKRFSLAPVIGITGGYKTVSTLGSSSPASEPTPMGLVVYQYTVRELDKDFFALLQGGLAFEYRAFERIRFSLGLNFYKGLSKTNIYDVSYRINNGIEQTGIMYSRGSFANLNAGIRYSLKKRI